MITQATGYKFRIKLSPSKWGEFFVFVSKDTIAEQRKVTLGPRIQSNVVVLTGLKPGEKIVTDGFQRLRDGGKITLGPPPSAAGAAGGKDNKSTAPAK
jgi:hypothetical protein